MHPMVLYWLRLTFLALAALLGPFITIVPHELALYLGAAVSGCAALAGLFTAPTPDSGGTAPAPLVPAMPGAPLKPPLVPIIKSLVVCALAGTLALPLAAMSPAGPATTAWPELVLAKSPPPAALPAPDPCDDPDQSEIALARCLVWTASLHRGR